MQHEVHTIDNSPKFEANWLVFTIYIGNFTEFRCDKGYVIMSVIIDLSKQIDILKDSDIFPVKEDEVIRVIELHSKTSL